MFRFVCSAALLGLSIGAPASAATMLVEIQKTSGFGAFETASFTVPEQPVPDFFTGNFFRIRSLGDFQFNDVPSSGDASFSISGLTIEFNIGPNSATFGLTGPVVFSGTPAEPTFVSGSYDFFGVLDIVDQGTEFGTATVTISRLDAPVIPEPATWAMLIAGFGLVGAGLRRRRAQVLA